ncbi:type VI secretion system-associated protein TagF [Gibbsiella quercinecans]
MMSNEHPLSAHIGWYGKIPAAGDFLQRRLPDAVINHWAHWFHNGLANLQRSLPDSANQVFSSAPVWNFAVPATLGVPYVQLGCLLPARDRVGRHYPICALRLFTPEQWRNPQLNHAAQWYQQLGYTLLNGVRNGYSAEQIDRALLAIPALPAPPPESESDILAIIGDPSPERPRLGWQQAADCFDPAQYTSFWWTNQADGHPLYTHVHSGNLTVQLFALLFELNGWARAGRRGQYPQMFD